MKTKKYLFPILVIIFVVAVIIAFSLYEKVSALKVNPSAVAQQQTNDIVARVGKLILLPTGETPTVATVSDPSKLADQPFFAKAKAGDEVLLYQNAKEAYLYDPVANKILEVAPINLGDTSAPTPATTPAKTTTTTTKKK